MGGGSPLCALNAPLFHEVVDVAHPATSDRPSRTVSSFQGLHLYWDNNRVLGQPPDAQADTIWVESGDFLSASLPYRMFRLHSMIKEQEDDAR